MLNGGRIPAEKNWLAKIEEISDIPMMGHSLHKEGSKVVLDLHSLCLFNILSWCHPPWHYLVNQIVDSICEQFASYRHLQLIKWILLRYMRDVSRGGKCVRNNLWVSQTLCFVVSISCTFFLPMRNRNRGRIFHAAPHLIRMFLAQHYFIRFCYAMEWKMKDMLQLKGWRWYQIWC